MNYLRNWLALDKVATPLPWGIFRGESNNKLANPVVTWLPLPESLRRTILGDSNVLVTEDIPPDLFTGDPVGEGWLVLLSKC